MKNTYLGESRVPEHETPFSGYLKNDWILYYIEKYGGICGEHHKDWLLDQIARILNDAPVEIKLASWSDGTIEYRVNVGTSAVYDGWVKNVKSSVDGPYTYEYNLGIAP